MKDDFISRAAALDFVSAMNFCGEISDEAYQKLTVHFENLPSAQSDKLEDTVYRKAVERLLAYFVPEERYAEAVDGLRRLPSAQPGWIPCDRELPKPNEEDGNGFYKAYLVQDGRWMDVARWDGKYWVAWGYSTVLLNVVAWQPLPTPYREGGHNA